MELVAVPAKLLIVLTLFALQLPTLLKGEDIVVQSSAARPAIQRILEADNLDVERAGRGAIMRADRAGHPGNDRLVHGAKLRRSPRKVSGGSTGPRRHSRAGGNPGSRALNPVSPALGPRLRGDDGREIGEPFRSLGANFCQFELKKPERQEDREREADDPHDALQRQNIEKRDLLGDQQDEEERKN